MGQTDIVCPACQGNDIALDGWNPMCKEVATLDSNFYIKARRYRHRNCPKALAQDGTTTFNSLDPRYIENLPVCIRHMLPFRVVTRETIVSQTVACLARESAQHCGFKAAADMHGAIKRTETLGRQWNMLNYFARMNAAGILFLNYLIFKIISRECRIACGREGHTATLGRYGCACHRQCQNAQTSC